MLFRRSGVVSVRRRLGRRWGFALVGCGVALAYACDSGTTRPTEPSIIENPTSPSALSERARPLREVDDIGATTGTPTTGCPDAGCTPGPQPVPVRGVFKLTAVDGSSMSGQYVTLTTASGLPISSGIGNSDTHLDGERRFAGIFAGIWSVKFESSRVEFGLRFQLAEPAPPGNMRNYADKGVFPYAAALSADSTCMSGQRVNVRFSGALENVGRFEVVLNHCVSAVA